MTIHLPRVLVVDDESMNLRAFRRLFRRDYAMAFATEGPEALEVLASRSFDVVLSDYRMTPMNGTTLLAAVRERHPTIHRALVTAYVEHPAVMDAIATGIAQEVVYKPYTPDQIRACVERLTLGRV